MIRSHEGTTRPAEASRKALRPRRSQTTPPRPRGLHPASALARTHQNEMQPRKADPLAKKCDKSLQASTNTPFEARGLLSSTIIRVPPTLLNSAGNHHQHKLQRLMGAIQVKAPSTQGTRSRLARAQPRAGTVVPGEFTPRSRASSSNGRTLDSPEAQLGQASQ